ncbi:MAG: glycerate kinase [Xanthobacteraceae bacterium]
MTDRRPLLRAIFEAAVARAHTDHVLATHLPPPPAGRIVCLAAGKGAAALAAAAERHYLDTLHLPPQRLTGLATTRHGHAVATRRIEVIEAGHPVPDAASQNAAERTLQFARQAQRDDLVLVLLSGGGSANWIAPAEGVSLAQKQGINRALLRSGANIGAMNAVRKHLSRIKGGRLAREAQPAPVVTLAISDVPDDDPAVIASGPTVPDPTTLTDAREVLARFAIVPDEAIAKALNDPSNESCKATDAFFANTHFALIARPRDSLTAAVGVARNAGFETIDLGECEGEAREVATAHAQFVRDARAKGRRVAIVSGGELTVTVRGRRGGPNQEYVLALASGLRDLEGVSALAADTDGADGGGGDASDPAGAFFDHATLRQMQRLGLDPDAYLAENDATGFFEQTGDLLTTGPTLTNVNDIRVILVE